MTDNCRMPNIARVALTLLLCSPAVLLAGCSQDFASADDVYVPVFSEERYPIEVMDKPFKLNVAANTGKLANEDINRLVAFARAAQLDGSSPVIVSYPSGSKKARGVSQQAVRILRSEGLDQAMIRGATYSGKSDIVQLSFTRKVASTRPCGDWSENLTNTSQNEPFPNSGCFMQNNLAAMVVNPEDFVAPQAPGDSPAAPRTAAMEIYQQGVWTDPANSSMPTIGTGP